MSLFGSLAVVAALQQVPLDRRSAILARINSDIVTSDDLDLEMRHQNLPVDNADLRRKILLQIARNKLQDQEAQKRGVRVDSKEVDAAVQRDLKNFKSEQEYEDWLRHRRQTRQERRGELEQLILRQKLMQRKYIDWISDPRTADTPIHDFVTPAALWRYYASNRREFEAQEYATLARITLSFQTEEERRNQKKIAESILRKVQVGTDLTILARVYSDAWRIERFDRTNKLFSTETTETILRKLGKGETSGILEEKGAMHIVKVLEKVSRSEESFEEAQFRIRTILANERGAENLKRLMKDLVEDAYIQPANLFEGEFDR